MQQATGATLTALTFPQVKTAQTRLVVGRSEAPRDVGTSSVKAGDLEHSYVSCEIYAAPSQQNIYY